MQFWTTELYAVVVIAVIGILLLAFLTAWLVASKGLLSTRLTGERYSGPKRVERTFTTKYVGGRRDKLFVLLAVLLATVGAIGILYFAQDLWTNPLYVSDYDLNLQFIFVVFSVMTFFIAFSVAALNKWASQKIGVGMR